MNNWNLSETEVIRLEGNFRCGSDICAVAQSLIIHNPDRIDKRTVSMTGRTGDVDLWKDIPTPGFEMQTLARDIIEKKAPTAAVLFRSNALAREYAEALKGAGVEVQEKKRTELPADWRLTRALLAVLSNPSNDALARMYLTVKHGPHEADVAVRQVAKAMHTINAECLHFQPLADPVDWNYVTTQLAQSGCTPQSIELVTAAVADLPAGSGMADLLFALASEQNTQEEAGTGVVVTTIHAAKGRQWHTVYLPAFEQAVIPGARKYPTEEAKAAAVEEERRLAYVGMTRAEERLVISSCQQRKTTWGNKPEPASPSQFVMEAGI